jgi:AcrR family transcriptional regulator
VNDTRSRILLATAELFRRQGFNGTSLKDITSLAGATTGSLYHFWPGGKNELTSEVLSTTGAAYGELFETVLSDADDLADGITAFFDGGAALLESTDFIDPCPIGTVAREVAGTHDALRSTALAVFEQWIATATTAFERAGIPPELARDLAGTLVMAIEGGFVVARTSRDTDQFRATGRQLRRLVEVSLAAVAAVGADRAT